MYRNVSPPVHRARGSSSRPGGRTRHRSDRTRLRLERTRLRIEGTPTRGTRARTLPGGLPFVAQERTRYRRRRSAHRNEHTCALNEPERVPTELRRVRREPTAVRHQRNVHGANENSYREQQQRSRGTHSCPGVTRVRSDRTPVAAVATHSRTGRTASRTAATRPPNEGTRLTSREGPARPGDMRQLIDELVRRMPAPRRRTGSTRTHTADSRTRVGAMTPRMGGSRTRTG